MSSFLEKLKKGMGIEVPEEPEKEKFEEKPKPVLKKKGVGKIKIETGFTEPSPQDFSLQDLGEKEIKKIEEEEKLKIKEEEKIKVKKEKWLEPEGQLAVDVYETKDQLVIQSAIAGVKPENLDISIEGDLVTIKGERENPVSDQEKRYFYQECYWGPFSREIILPEETDPNRIEATMKEGVLTIRIAKIERKKKRKIEVRG